jgi:hypothetical protein
VFGVDAMVHHEDAEDIELCVLGGFVVEEVIVFLEEFFEFGVVVAAGGGEDQVGGYGEYDGFMWERSGGGDSEHSFDVRGDGDVGVCFDSFL